MANNLELALRVRADVSQAVSQLNSLNGNINQIGQTGNQAQSQLGNATNQSTTAINRQAQALENASDSLDLSQEIRQTQRLGQAMSDTAQATQNTVNINERMEQSLRSLTPHFMSLIGLSGGLMTASLNALEKSVELRNKATISGMNVEQFQYFAVGAKTVGIEMDKLSDIFKDTRDKVGDFLVTGGGELQDFFEEIAPQVGVTAEQFRHLSGADALQLYVNSLREADLAGRVASRDMKIIQSHLKKFKIVLDRRAYALQPASAFVLKIPQRGIDSMMMRAVRVEHGTLTNGEITVTAVQDVFGLPRTTYSQVQPSLWIQPSLSPEPITHSRLWQLPYTHLLEVFSPEQLALNSDGYALVMAERPNSLQQGFEIWAKTADEPAEQYAGQGQFIARGVVQNAVAQTSQITTLTLDNIGVMSIGQCALLNDEIVQIAHIDLTNKQIQVKRGCMDTVPTAHDENSAIWFYDDVAVVAEKAVKVGQTLTVKLLSQTSQGTLDIAKATANSLLVSNRHACPFAPANVQINGLSYPNQIQELTQISWVGRNKISQNTAILDQTAPHQEPETGATVSLIISKKTSANGSYQRVVQKDGITGFFIDIVKENPNNDETKLVANLENAVMIKVELWAVKDGLASLQRHSIEVAVG